MSALPIIIKETGVPSRDRYLSTFVYLLSLQALVIYFLDWNLISLFLRFLQLISIHKYQSLVSDRSELIGLVVGFNTPNLLFHITAPTPPSSPLFLNFIGPIPLPTLFQLLLNDLLFMAVQYVWICAVKDSYEPAPVRRTGRGGGMSLRESLAASRGGRRRTHPDLPTLEEDTFTTVVLAQDAVVDDSGPAGGGVGRGGGGSGGGAGVGDEPSDDGRFDFGGGGGVDGGLGGAANMV